MIIDSRTLGSYYVAFTKDSSGYHIRVFRHDKLDEDLSDDIRAKEVAEIYYNNVCKRIEMEQSLK